MGAIQLTAAGRSREGVAVGVFLCNKHLLRQRPQRCGRFLLREGSSTSAAISKWPKTIVFSRSGGLESAAAYQTAEPVGTHFLDGPPPSEPWTYQSLAEAPDEGPLNYDANVTGDDVNNYLTHGQIVRMQSVRGPGDYLQGQAQDPPPPWEEP